VPVATNSADTASATARRELSIHEGLRLRERRSMRRSSDAPDPSEDTVDAAGVALRALGGATIVVVCAACAMAAAAGASGARTWLQARDMAWLTPQRMKAMTVALFIAAFGVSSVGLSSSSSARVPTPPAAHAAR
jgi:hypothetical protein